MKPEEFLNSLPHHAGAILAFFFMLVTWPFVLPMTIYNMMKDIQEIQEDFRGSLHE